MVLLIDDLILITIVVIIFVILIYSSVIITVIISLWIGSGGVLYILTLLAPALDFTILGVQFAAASLTGLQIAQLAGVQLSEKIIKKGNEIEYDETYDENGCLIERKIDLCGNGGSKNFNSLEDYQKTCIHSYYYNMCKGGTVVGSQNNQIIVKYADGTLKHITSETEKQKILYNNFRNNTEIFPEIPFGKLLSMLIRTANSLQQKGGFRAETVLIVLRILINVIQSTIYNVNMFFLHFVIILLPKSDLLELDTKFPWLDVHHLVFNIRKKYTLLNNLLNFRARLNKKFAKLVYDNLNAGGYKSSLLRYIDHYIPIIKFYKDNDYDTFIKNINYNHSKFGVKEFNHPFDEYEEKRSERYNDIIKNNCCC